MSFWLNYLILLQRKLRFNLIKAPFDKPENPKISTNIALSQSRRRNSSNFFNLLSCSPAPVAKLVHSSCMTSSVPGSAASFIGGKISSSRKQGWEGTAHDARIFLATLRNDSLNFSKPPQGKYYLVDAGYPQMSGFLGPYRGERYHLPDFRRGRRPMGPQEVFNHAHSSLRSVIKRTFGVWKKRWKILRDMPSYPFTKQVKIVIATMALHNYIRRYSRRDYHFKKMVDNPDSITIEGNESEVDGDEDRTPATREMVSIRDNITASLMKV